MTLPTFFLLLAVAFWALAAFKCPETRILSWGWAGMLCFGLSLLWPHLHIG